MKKIMIATALVAVASGAFAATASKTNTIAQVYQMAMSAKQTEAVNGSITALSNPFRTGATSVVYRDVTTKVYNGLIWGCGCETIGGKKVAQAFEANADSSKTNVYYNGAMIWDTETHLPVWVSTTNNNGLAWAFINAIGQTGQKCEGSFDLLPVGTCTGTNQVGIITFSGFGTLGREMVDAAGALNCTYYVENMSGDFAGYLAAPVYYKAGKTDCYYCGDVVTPSTCADAEAWEWCYCDNFADKTLSAIHGQWYIRFSDELSEALSENKSIGDVYDFGGRTEKLFKAYELNFVDKNF